MIPISLVTGFLGSGKTTLLRHLARRHRDRRMVWLVNEFCARDLDAARLAEVADDVVSIAGGSIFCRCLVTDFLEHLRGLPERFGRPGAPVEGVVVEASGMADPAGAGRMLAESRLDRVYAIASVVTVVDPGSLLKLLHTLPNIRVQIGAATLVLINKTDLHPPGRIAETEDAVRAINPSVPILRTRLAEAEIDLFGTGASAALRGDLAPCRDPHFDKIEWAPAGGLDLDALRAAVASLREDVYRIKGVAHVGGRRMRLDYSASGWQVEEGPGDQAPALVFIVRGGCADAVRRLVGPCAPAA